MFGTGLIVFRETLEAALFIGILAAATRSIEHRSRWLIAGIAMGLLGSVLVALGLERISEWADGLGQDVLNACILGAAVTMLAWHSIWVSAHAKEMTQQARQIGQDVTQEAAALWAVSLAVAMTVLREGSETVLFVAGLFTSSSEGVASLMLGALGGLVSGAMVGWFIYSGLGRIQPRRLFAITHVLIVMLAGNLASQLAKTLQQADWLQAFGDKAWDSSAWLTNDSMLGLVLHGVVGYEASPSQLQVLFYGLTALLLILATQAVRQRAPNPKQM